MNRKPVSVRSDILRHLADGMGVRETARLTGVSKNTVRKLQRETPTESILADFIFRSFFDVDEIGIEAIPVDVQAFFLGRAHVVAGRVEQYILDRLNQETDFIRAKEREACSFRMPPIQTEGE